MSVSRAELCLQLRSIKHNAAIRLCLPVFYVSRPNLLFLSSPPPPRSFFYLHMLTFPIRRSVSGQLRAIITPHFHIIPSVCVTVANSSGGPLFGFCTDDWEVGKPPARRINGLRLDTHARTRARTHSSNSRQRSPQT